MARRRRGRRSARVGRTSARLRRLRNTGTAGRVANDETAWLYATTGLLVFNNVFAYNTRTDDVSGVYGSLYVMGTFQNNIVFKNESGVSYGSANIDYNLSYGNQRANFVNYGATLGEHNLEADPRFHDPDADDYSLDAFSPALDAGNPASAYDDVDGSPNDTGMYGGPNGRW